MLLMQIENAERIHTQILIRKGHKSMILLYLHNLKINTSFNPLYFYFFKFVQIILERIYLNSKIYATLKRVICY